MKNDISIELYRPIAGSLRIFWKIIVDAQSDSLRVVKELSLWGATHRRNEEDELINAEGKTSDADGNPVGLDDAAKIRHRYMWKQIPLQVEIGWEDEGFEHRDQRKVSVEDGLIYFNNGYLKIYDTSLVEDVRIWGLDLPDTTGESIAIDDTVEQIRTYFKVIEASVNPEDLDKEYDRPEGPQYPEEYREGDTIYHAGYNVRLEADIALADSTDVEDHAIFYYPQDPAVVGIGVVSLSVMKESDEHKLLWQITGRDYEPRPYHLEELHSIVVNHEKINDASAEFTFMADTIPLPPDDGTVSFAGDAGHPFSRLGRFFYVGYSPRTGDGFHGYVRRIMFDPNASCAAC